MKSQTMFTARPVTTLEGRPRYGRTRTPCGGNNLDILLAAHDKDQYGAPEDGNGQQNPGSQYTAFVHLARDS